MKTIITLLLAISSLGSKAQESKAKVADAKKEQIAPVQIKAPQLISMDYIDARDPNWLTNNYTFAQQQLEKMSIIDLRDVLSELPGVYQSRRGDDLHIYGARANSTLYIVDGVQLQRK